MKNFIKTTPKNLRFVLIILPSFLLLTACSQESLSAFKQFVNGLPIGDKLTGQVNDFVNALVGTNSKKEHGSLNNKIVSGNMGEAYKGEELSEEQGSGHPFIMFDKDKGILNIGTEERKLSFKESDSFKTNGHVKKEDVITLENSEGTFSLIHAHEAQGVFAGISKKKGAYPDFYIKNTYLMDVSGSKTIYSFPQQEESPKFNEETLGPNRIHRAVNIEKTKYYYYLPGHSSNTFGMSDTKDIEAVKVAYTGEVLAVDISDLQSNIIAGSSKIWLALSEDDNKKVLSEVELSFAGTYARASNLHDLADSNVFVLDDKNVMKKDDNVAKISVLYDDVTDSINKTKEKIANSDLTENFKYEMYVNGRDFGQTKNVPLGMFARFSYNPSDINKHYVGVFSGSLVIDDEMGGIKFSLRNLFPLNEGGDGDCIGYFLDLAANTDSTDCVLSKQ